MGSTIYTQKAKHPVYVSFTCEHCGQYNTFVQEIVGSSSAEVRYGSSKKNEQDKINKLGPGAENDLARKIQKIEHNLGSGNYSWLKAHKCTKCRYAQSWQIRRIWMRSIKFFVLDIFILLIFCNWFTESSPESRTSEAWVLFAILGVLMLIPIAILIISLLKRDKNNRNKPDVRI